MLVTLGALTCAALAASLAVHPGPGRHRLARLRPHVSRLSTPTLNSGLTAGGTGHLLESTRGRLGAAGVAGLGAAIVLGGPLAVPLGVAVGLVAWLVLSRLESASAVRERERIVALLPFASSLLTAALAAGCPPVRAVEHVGRALPGQLGERLVLAASAARLGGEPAHIWSHLTDEPALQPLAHALDATTTRGTSPTAVFDDVARRARDSARWAATSRARSLGARAAAPLGLCFLPAFVLMGIVPVVATSGLGFL